MACCSGRRAQICRICPTYQPQRAHLRDGLSVHLVRARLTKAPESVFLLKYICPSVSCFFLSGQATNTFHTMLPFTSFFLCSTLQLLFVVCFDSSRGLSHYEFVGHLIQKALILLCNFTTFQ